MAKIVKIERLVAKNGAYIRFQTWPGGPNKPEIPCFDIQHAHWPLDELDELVRFVNAHRENLKQAEMQTED